MLPAHVSGSRSLLAAVQREFARLRTLDHPNIARLLDLGSNGEHHYVTAERLDGEPLREVLNHLAPERPEITEADDIVRAVGSALLYAHEHGIAHGDVRAENVMVTMDRRYVLTNFLARRISKVPGRPPRPSDDLKGLARLAAELYTGSMSSNALRTAVHDDVPAARLHAIRSVLEASSRRPGDVARFLQAAGLEPLAPPPAPVRKPAAAQRPHRSWSIWRFVVPMAAVGALGALFAAYQGGVSASAQELTVRGLDALRAVAARVVPEAPVDAAPPPESSGSSEPEPQPSPSAASAAAPGSSAPAESLADADSAPAPAEDAAPPELKLELEEEPAAATPPAGLGAGADTPSVASGPPAEPTAAKEPPIVSLGVPRIAAREDHSVVAIDVVRSGDTTGEATVGWWTTPDTADQDDDYADSGVQTVRFAAGASVERVLIPIVNDGVREPAERFTVHLGRPRGGVPGSVTATSVTLHDDD
jgi:hypothetical protein